MQTIFSSLNVLYFSKDIEYLLPLPINQKKIIISKIICLLVSVYIMSLLIIIPGFIVYGIIMKANILFYLISLITTILFPIIPVTLVVLIITVIMNYTKIIKNKDFVQYITVFLTMIMVIGIQFFSSYNENITNEQIADMLIKTNGLTDVYTKNFITLKPALNAIINYDNFYSIKNILKLFLETALFFIIVINISSRLYISSATRLSSSVNQKKIKLNNIKEFKSNKVITSYLKKEFLVLLRNPIFFMQCILPPIIFPIIFSIPVFIGLKNGNMESINELKILFENMSITECFTVLIVVIQFIFVFNFIAVTAISRDGVNANFIKYIPISLHKQCIYKILPNVILNIVPILYITFGSLIVLPNINFTIAFFILIIAFIINVLFSYIMIIIDLINPKLIWLSEYSVVKQNINLIYEIITDIIFIVFSLLIGYNINSFKNLVILLTIIYLICIIVLNKFVIKNEKKLFKKIT